MSTRQNALAIALAFLCIPCAEAAKPPLNGVTISCQNTRLPTYKQVSKLLGVNNSTHVFSVREGMMAVARRACHRAADPAGTQILFVPAGQTLSSADTGLTTRDRLSRN